MQYTVYFSVVKKTSFVKFIHGNWCWIYEAVLFPKTCTPCILKSILETKTNVFRIGIQQRAIVSGTFSFESRNKCFTSTAVPLRRRQRTGNMWAARIPSLLPDLPLVHCVILSKLWGCFIKKGLKYNFQEISIFKFRVCYFFSPFHSCFFSMWCWGSRDYMFYHWAISCSYLVPSMHFPF